MVEKVFISCIVPVKNSALFIEHTFKQLQAHLLAHFPSHELIFVDDCSNDQTLNILKNIQSGFPAEVRVVKLLKPLGQHLATLAGMLMAKGEFVVTIDDDMQFSAADIATLYNRLRDTGADVCYGIPFKKTYSTLYRKVFYKLLLFLVKTIFRRNSFLSSFRLMKHQTVVLLTSNITRFTNIEYIIRTHNVNFATVYVAHHPGYIRKSRYNFISLTSFLLKSIITYKSKTLLQLFAPVFIILAGVLWYLRITVFAILMLVVGVLFVIFVLKLRKHYLVRFALQEYMKYEA